MFDPIRIGRIDAKNRIVLAPITRSKATPEGVPTDAMAIFYRQRASVGLITSEATSVSEESHCLRNSPGIWAAEQVEGWKKVTTAVHEAGGKIICQLWHPGRAAHSSMNGVHPISASETRYPGLINTPSGEQESEVARAASVDDIRRIVNDFRTAAVHAIEAGFDGVQVHCANGYLVGQFMNESTNLRNDEYGGSIDNRLRFFREVVSAVVHEVGADRTGVRFSPHVDASSLELFLAAAGYLEQTKVAFIGLRENSPLGPLVANHLKPRNQVQVHVPIRSVYNGALVINNDFTLERAMEAIQTSIADAVSVGRPAMASPHLVAKMQATKQMRVFNDSVKWWYHEPEGYIDLPEAVATAAVA